MIKLVFRNIFRHKLKSFLIAFGIILGTVSVITVFSLGHSGASQLDGLFSAVGFDGVVLTAPANAHTVFEGKLSSGDIDYISSEFDEVRTTMPLVYTPAYYGTEKKHINGYAVGFTDNTEAVADSTLKYGRTFTRAEIMSLDNVCLVDNETAYSLFGRENIVGKKVSVQIHGNEKSFCVVGVISNDSPIGAIVKTYTTNNIYLPYTIIDDMQGSSSYMGVILSLYDNDNDTVKATLLSKISEYKNVDGYILKDLSAQEKQIKNLTEKFTLIISAVAGVSLIVAGSGIMSVMLSNVQERKKEIGIKLSVGAAPKRIRNEFLLESVIISVISGCIGLIISSLLVNSAGNIIGLNLNVEPLTAIFALLFCGIIGIIFSVYPANKAASLNPVECLRCD